MYYKKKKKKWDGERGRGSRNARCERFSSSQPSWAPVSLSVKGGANKTVLGSLFFSPQVRSLLYTLMKQCAISSHVAAKAHFAYWFFKDTKTVLKNA